MISIPILVIENYITVGASPGKTRSGRGWKFDDILQETSHRFDVVNVSCIETAHKSLNSPQASNGTCVPSSVLLLSTT